jgi:hypothetical protein
MIDNLRATCSSAFNVRCALRICQHRSICAEPAARHMFGRGAGTGAVCELAGDDVHSTGDDEENHEFSESYRRARACIGMRVSFEMPWRRARKTSRRHAMKILIVQCQLYSSTRASTMNPVPLV